MDGRTGSDLELASCQWVNISCERYAFRIFDWFEQTLPRLSKNGVGIQKKDCGKNHM